MKSIVSMAAALAAGLTVTATAHADVKNVGGLVCKHYTNSEAPKSAEHITFTGHLCNNSSTQRLRVTCPLTQDHGAGKNVSVTFDYVNWNLNGINGNQNANPDQEFLCTVMTRTRYAQAYFWGGWKSAAAFPGYGATPTAMYASAAMLDDGFTHGVCYIPRKYDNKRSCVSHLKYNEQ
jgi:hypothetical protein